MTMAKIHKIYKGGYADGGLVTDQQPPAVEAIKDTVRDPQAAKMLDLDLARLTMMNQPVQRMAGGGAVKADQQQSDSMRLQLLAGGGSVDMPYGGVSIDNMPDTNAFSVNSKPSSQAYTALGVPLLDESGQVKPNPQTSYDLRMADLEKKLETGIKPDWMSDTDFAQDQVSRGRGQGHILPAALSAMSLPYEAAEKVIGSSMGLDPMTGMIGKVGEFHNIPKAGQYMASRAAPFAKDVGAMANELYMSGKMPLTVNPTFHMAEPVKSAERVLAPANEQGFYSPTEAAALNLQRKSGQGQAFLNDLMKGDNVRPDEINAMGLDTFLKGKTNVTADEVRDYIAKNKIQLGEAKYGELTPRELSAEWERLAQQEYGKSYGELYDNEANSIERIIKNDREPKFKEYSMPGGENYREVVLTLPTKTVSEAEARAILGAKPDAKLTEADIKFASRKNAEEYQSSHWDEANPLAHIRLKDFTDVEGKKTLLVDEVQSDWHQQGRERGYKTPLTEQEAAEYKALDSVPMGSLNPEQYQRLRQFSLKENEVPQAPYKEDWYQLALKRAIKEAIDGGYDRVALPTGKRVIDRFSDQLRQNVDEINFSSGYPNNETTTIAATKQGQVMFEGTVVDGKFIDGAGQGKTVNEVLGKSIANQISSHDPSSGLGVIKGDDLSVGGEGMKKYYDEIYPGYLKKFGKKYGASVGKTTVDADGVAEPLHYMDITPAMRKEFSTGIHMKNGGKVQFANDLDAMKYALMNDAGYKKGGQVKERLFDEQDKGDWFNKKGERRLPRGDKKIRSPLLRPPKGTRFPVTDPKMEKDFDFSSYPIKKVPVEDLYSIQNNVREDNLKPKRKHGKPIHVVIWKGKYWVVDGNHRASEFWAAGEKNIHAHVLNLDDHPEMENTIFGGGAVKPRPIVSDADFTYNLDEMRHALVRRQG